MASKKQMKILRFSYNREVSHSDILKKLHMRENQINDLYEIMKDGSFENQYLSSRIGENGNPLFICNESGRALVETSRKEFVGKWIPHIVTTIIAIAALINSILARLGK